MVSFANSDQGNNIGLRSGGLTGPGSTTEGTEGDNEDQDDDSIEAENLYEEVTEESNLDSNEEVESVENESSSKYNFIFYFLYKFKYGEARETESTFQSFF